MHAAVHCSTHCGQRSGGPSLQVRLVFRGTCTDQHRVVLVYVHASARTTRSCQKHSSVVCRTGIQRNGRGCRSATARWWQVAVDVQADTSVHLQ